MHMVLNFFENEPLAKYTAWRIGGPARFFANAATAEALRTARGWAQNRGLALFVLGGGTNLLVRDNGFDGLVVRLRDQSLRVEAGGDDAVARVGAGAPMAGTARRLAGMGWAGLEWAEGLPGTIGGAVFGNAGCYGGDIAKALRRAWLLAGDTIEEWPAARFAYGYRTSALKRTKSEELLTKNDGADASAPFFFHPSSSVAPIVLEAEFGLRRADPRALAEQMQHTAAERKRKTPVGSSCGSVFKNPPGDSAGRLIEAAGLKGTRIGNAEIATRHANYIVNLGGASSDDVLKLIELARERVLREFGIALTLEVEILG
ncbi:UDP-N-acetylmuramate dehydrogenase [Kouleothrix sp.]|uniref:UDP-N-acetylmuramate dehydrogenase n=1 Tax=Kouleothrix sp. TaxID=2779161 RepID=UPI00391C5BF4